MDTISLVGVDGRDARPAAPEPRRSRSYTAEEKRRLMAESYEPGASAARRHDINANLLFTWRSQVHAPSAPAPSGARWRTPPSPLHTAAGR